MGERGGQRAYGRHRGVTHRAVQVALKNGRISYDEDGLIDFDKADALWQANTDQSKPRNSVSGDPHHRRLPGDVAAPGIRDGGEDGAGSRGGMAYAIARAARESFEAKIKKLEFEKMTGKLVDAEQVRLAWFNTARRARDTILAVPDRIAPIIAGSSDPIRISEIHKLLSIELRRVCEELAKDAPA